MTRPKLGDRRLLPIELARESVDLAATGQRARPCHVTLSTQSASRPSPKTKPMRVAQVRRKREVEKRQVSILIRNFENSGMRAQALPGAPVVTPIMSN